MADKDGSIKSSEYSGTSKSASTAIEIKLPSDADLELLNRSSQAYKIRKKDNKAKKSGQK
jgi:hypothetical protein